MRLPHTGSFNIVNLPYLIDDNYRPERHMSQAPKPSEKKNAGANRFIVAAICQPRLQVVARRRRKYASHVAF
jgi:hypothetical protein